MHYERWPGIDMWIRWFTSPVVVLCFQCSSNSRSCESMLEGKGKNNETVSVSAQLHTSVALPDKFVTLLVSFE